MSSFCQNKDAAWEFIRELFLPKYRNMKALQDMEEIEDKIVRTVECQNAYVSGLPVMAYLITHRKFPLPVFLYRNSLTYLFSGEEYMESSGYGIRLFAQSAGGSAIQPETEKHGAVSEKHGLYLSRKKLLYIGNCSGLPDRHRVQILEQSGKFLLVFFREGRTA